MNTLDIATQVEVSTEIILQLQELVVFRSFCTRYVYLSDTPIKRSVEIENDLPIWVDMPDSEWIPRRLHFRIDDVRIVAQLDGYMVPSGDHRRPGLTYAVDFDR